MDQFLVAMLAVVLFAGIVVGYIIGCCERSSLSDIELTEGEVNYLDRS